MPRFLIKIQRDVFSEINTADTQKTKKTESIES
jgi:hypothetical protein